MSSVHEFCLFMPYLSIFSVLHGKNLILLNLINRYVLHVSNFLKSWHNGNQKCKFLISANHLFSVTQIAAVTTEQVVLIYTYMNVSFYWPQCVRCVFVCMCDLFNQSTCKKPHCHVLELSKLDAFRGYFRNWGQRLEDAKKGTFSLQKS